MQNLISFLTITLLLAGCSLSNSGKEQVSSKPSDELEFAVDTLKETSSESDIVVEEQKIAQDIPEQAAEVKPEEMKIVVKDEGKAPDLVLPAEPQTAEYITQSQSLGAEEKYYVQKGDTLMMIAFKIYGDYRKWKELKEWNKEIEPSKIGPGVVLKYYVPESSFGWQPSGLPYMVKTGDTLGTISMEKYGTSKKWKNIYDNNRPLIRNPNYIFAGFTIYYVPVRDVASEVR
ncbi:MAG: LysM peptidoglycan-binding domain-containing protein [Bacteriovorax sp.]